MVNASGFESFGGMLLAALARSQKVMLPWRVRGQVENPKLRYYLGLRKSLNLATPKAFAANAQRGSSGRATPSLRADLDNASMIEKYATHNPAQALT
jgi:hypothetical protein